MSAHLLQIKVDPSLKEKLQRIAMSKGLNLTSYIKMSLIEASDSEEDLVLTENGFTVREEKRLLRSIEEGEDELAANKLKSFSSMKAALKSLE